MRKLDYDAKTLDNKSIKDGLCAVSFLDESPISSENWFVVGGIATQSYLPSLCRRSTSDIDLAIVRPLTYSEFKGFSRPAVEYLEDNGYETDLRRGHSSYILRFSDNERAQIIEFSRKSRNYFARVKERLSLELQNSRTKTIEGRDLSCRMASPEDIAVPKLVRSVNALSRSPGLRSYMPWKEKSSLSEQEIVKKLRRIGNLREEAILSPGDVELSERLRFYSDLYDIRVLSEITGYNVEDFRESMLRWNTLMDNGKSKERDLIFGKTLPTSDLWRTERLK